MKDFETVFFFRQTKIYIAAKAKDHRPRILVVNGAHNITLLRSNFRKNAESVDEGGLGIHLFSASIGLASSFWNALQHSSQFRNIRDARKSKS
jgi:hypothetical protein